MTLKQFFKLNYVKNTITFLTFTQLKNLYKYLNNKNKNEIYINKLCNLLVFDKHCLDFNERIKKIINLKKMHLLKTHFY